MGFQTELLIRRPFGGDGGFGLQGNIIIGLIGGVVGGFLLRLMAIVAAGGLIGSIVTATLGAVILLLLLGLFKKA